MSSFDDKQVMVTLAALAYVAPIPDDGDHTIEEEEQFMLGELTKALADPFLATQGKWSVPWIGLSEGQTNLVYIAQNASEDKLAIVVRGTVFGLSWEGLVDVFEDLRVGTLADFTVGKETVSIAYGANVALGELTQAAFAVPGNRRVT